jgi:uncharacterized protein (TIGR03437 family)
MFKPAAPSLFVANEGAVGFLDLVASDGTQTLAPLKAYLSTSGAAQAYLILYGTGIRGANGSVTATLDGLPVSVTYPGAAPGFAGLDQVNILIPAGFVGGYRSLQLAVTAAGIASNVGLIFLQ